MQTKNKFMQLANERHKVTSGTKEWADYNYNCILGCLNDCRYCYAKMMARRFGRSNASNWKDMKIRKEILNKKVRKVPGRIMFPSTHDIIENSPYKEACFTALENLLINGNIVLVTSKPRLAIVKEIESQFSKFREQIQFRFTITSCSDELLKFWEPNAPLFQERFSSLQFAFIKGFKTSVSIEPFLDYNPLPLIDKVIPYITESIWIGRMNYIACRNLSDLEQSFYNKVRENYETKHLLEIVRNLSSHPKIRFKDSIRNQINRIPQNKIEHLSK
jgi:DNA repair photolyase